MSAGTRRPRRPPAALAALLAATAILALGWMAAVPAFQAPDENAHFAYVQFLVERGELPASAGAPRLSTEQTAAADAANAVQTQQQPHTKPEWSARAHERYLRRAERLGERARADGGPNPAGVNPPLYYAWEALPYAVASQGDVFSRVTAMRLWSVPFLLITVAATWLLAGTVFGPRRELQLAAAAVPALVPMVTFIASSVSPDGLVYAMWTLTFLFGARIVTGRGGPADMAALLASFVLAVASKSISFALAPSVLVALAVVLWRLRHRRRLVAAVTGSALALVALASAAAVALSRSSDRPVAEQISEYASLDGFDPAALASYVWQLYLPPLSFQTGYPELDTWPPRGYEFWVEKGWGAFGWLEVTWPPAVYWVLGLLTLAVGVAAAVALWRRRRQVDVALLAFFGVAPVTLLFGLHWTEFQMLRDTHALINQGRYLFPLVALGGLTLAAALTLLTPRRRMLALGAGVGGLAALELLSLGLTAVRFYA